MKTRKFTKTEIKKLKKHWAILERIEYNFLKKVDNLEKEMSKDLNIEDLIFFLSDGGYCGIGNETRTIDLIHSHKLEKRK